MRKPLAILIVAGEASGDRHGAGLAEELARLSPGIRLLGMGGRRMREAGVDTLVDSEPLAVTGLFEVLGHLGRLRRAMRSIEEAIRRERPAAAILVDYPDFNLRLAAIARRLGTPVVYFVSPQLWAWRPGRARTVATLVNRLLVIFPFEEAFYRDRGIPVEFVGHPLAEEIGTPPPRAEVRRALGLPDGAPYVALLPGSRRNEVERLLPPLLDAARRIHAAEPRVRFLLSRAPGLPQDILPDERPGGGKLPLLVLPRKMREIVRAADLAVAAMGTATLETALLETPFVAIYRVHPLTHSIGRRLVKLEQFAMPNLILGRTAFPELVQDACTGSRIAAEVLSVLRSDDRRDEMSRACLEVREKLLVASRGLAGRGAYERAAGRVLETAGL